MSVEWVIIILVVPQCLEAGGFKHQKTNGAALTVLE